MPSVLAAQEEVKKLEDYQGEIEASIGYPNQITDLFCKLRAKLSYKPSKTTRISWYGTKHSTI